MSRELDAEIATTLFGFQVVGVACAIHVDGEWSVHADSSPEGWACYAGMEPVYVERCCCADDAVRNWNRERLAKHDRAEVDEFMASLEHEYVHGHHQSCLEVVPEYSERIGEAWRVVEKMRERRWMLSLNNEAAVWDATFCREPDYENRRGAFEAVDAQAATAPEAICKAALAALLVPNGVPSAGDPKEP